MARSHAALGRGRTGAAAHLDASAFPGGRPRTPGPALGADRLLWRPRPGRLGLGATPDPRALPAALARAPRTGDRRLGTRHAGRPRPRCGEGGRTAPRQHHRSCTVPRHPPRGLPLVAARNPPHGRHGSRPVPLHSRRAGGVVGSRTGATVRGEHGGRRAGHLDHRVVGAAQVRTAGRRVGLRPMPCFRGRAHVANGAGSEDGRARRVGRNQWRLADTIAIAGHRSARHRTRDRREPGAGAGVGRHGVHPCGDPRCLSDRHRDGLGPGTRTAHRFRRRAARVAGVDHGHRRSRPHPRAGIAGIPPTASAGRAIRPVSRGIAHRPQRPRPPMPVHGQLPRAAADRIQPRRNGHRNSAGLEYRRRGTGRSADGRAPPSNARAAPCCGSSPQDTERRWPGTAAPQGERVRSWWGSLRSCWEWDCRPRWVFRTPHREPGG